MYRIVGQVGFLKDIQVAFESGRGDPTFVIFLVMFMAAALPLVIGLLLWKYHDRIFFRICRMVDMAVNRQLREKVQAHLLRRRVTMDVLIVGKKTRRHLCRAVLGAVDKNTVELDILTEVPSRWHRALMGKKIICFTKPFSYSGQRINSFTSYIKGAKAKATGLATLTLLTPSCFKDVSRRKHLRKKISRPGAIGIKMWTGSKKTAFKITTPDFQSVEGLQHDQRRIGLARAVNISPGGIRIEVRLNSRSPSLKVHAEVVVALAILDVKTKKFNRLSLLGAIRSLHRTDVDKRMMGIQFKAVEIGGPDQKSSWKAVGDEIPQLAKMLAAMQKTEKGGK